MLVEFLANLTEGTNAANRRALTVAICRRFRVHLDTQFIPGLAWLVSLYRLTLDEVDELYETFLLFDKNGDDMIDSEELGILFQNSGRNPSDSELQTMINEFDVDHDGVFDDAEFIIMMARRVRECRIARENFNREAFKLFDKDDDGFISFAELRAGMRDKGRDLSDDEVAEIFCGADTNGDGQISYEEFVIKRLAR